MKNTFEVGDLLYAIQTIGFDVYEAKVEIIYDNNNEYLVRGTNPYHKTGSPHVVVPSRMFKNKMFAVQKAMKMYNNFMSLTYPDEVKKLKIIERIKKIS